MYHGQAIVDGDKYPFKDESVKHANVTFFYNKWTKIPGVGNFDLIYDYTVRISPLSSPLLYSQNFCLMMIII